MPIFLLTTLSIILILATGWLAYGLPTLLEFTSTIISWCKDILFQCLGYLSIARFSFVLAGATIVGGGLLYGFTRGIWDVVKTHRAIKRLPKADYGLGIVLIKDGNIKVAFTHGLFRPKIYISSGLIKDLTRSELNAVVLHEFHHKHCRDPLRFLLLSMLRDTFFYLPIRQYIYRLLHDIRERSADDRVVSTTGEPFGLAGALVKIARFGNGYLSLQAVSRDRLAPSITGTGMLEARVKRLIERRDEGIKPPALRTTILSLVMGVVLLVSLALPIWASPWVYSSGMCDIGHCAMHIDKIGEGCMTHCKSH